MFERFTDRARRVLILAQEEASLLQHDYIGTEHLLLGIVREGETIAYQVLRENGIGYDQVRKLVEEHLGPAESSGLSRTPPFTPRTKKVLELSLREALQLGHNYIGVEHIVLAMIRESGGLAVQILESEGRKTLEGLRRALIERLGAPVGVIEEMCSVTMSKRERQELIQWITNFDQTNGPLAQRHVLAKMRERLLASS